MEFYTRAFRSIIFYIIKTLKLMKNIPLLLFVLIIIVGFNSCKNTEDPPPIVGPEIPKEPKDPRKMTWTVDTLDNHESPQLLMDGVCGTNAADLYIYGHNAYPGESGGYIYHWNGIAWLPLKMWKFGPTNAMLAFSPANILFVGKGIGTMVIKWDGRNFTETWPSDQVPGELLCIAGDSPDNIYAGGRNGVVINYNKGSWRTDNVKISIPQGGEYFLRGATVYNDTCFFLGYVTDPANLTNKHYFIKGSYGNWIVSDSIIESTSTNWKWGWWGLYVTPYNKLWSFGSRGVFEYSDGKWTRLGLNEFWLTSSVYSFSPNYTVTVGHNGTVYFYDGLTWMKLEKFASGYEHITFNAVWGDGNELFIVGTTYGPWPQKTFIFHGK